jgi:hypothetical protein
MSGTRKVKPHFKNGRYIIKGFHKKDFELTEYTWSHILKDRSRLYFEDHFDKIEAALKKPDRILQSNKEENVVYYERFFDNFFIGNTVLGRVYVYILVNTKTERIRTVYFNPRRKGKKQIWPKVSK